MDFLLNMLCYSRSLWLSTLYLTYIYCLPVYSFILFSYTLFYSILLYICGVLTSSMCPINVFTVHPTRPWPAPSLTQPRPWPDPERVLKHNIIGNMLCSLSTVSMVLYTVSVSMAYNDMVLTEGDHACAKKKYVWGWPTQKVGSVGSVSLCIALTPNGKIYQLT